ncbi:hypothetical protein LCGC14_0960740 [marine sediment metagenome]|uniref:Terminase small subunit n=1 Tax=marine sediment metagenome TaxID=412755 RepID=A0A0F9RL27_9ZZZZ
MVDRRTGDLTAQEAKACVYRAQGKSKAESYRLAFTQRKCTEKSLIEQASQLFAKSQIQSRVRDLLASVKAADIITIGESMVELLDFKAMAIEDRAHAALANYKRMELQVLGALKDNLAVTMEARATDKVLLEQLAGQNKAKLALAKEMLGAEDTFDQSIDKAGVERERQYEQARKATKSQGQDWERGVKMSRPGVRQDEGDKAFKAGQDGQV